MRPDKPKPTKSELLAELESIRYSLSDEEIEELGEQEDLEIPVLVEPVSLADETEESSALADETASMTLTSIDEISEDDLIFDDSGSRARDHAEKTKEKKGVTYRPSAHAEGNNPGTAASESEGGSGIAEKSVVFSRSEPDSPEATITTMDEKPDYSEPSPGQQSLFEQPPLTKKEARTPKEDNPAKTFTPASGSGENPFLPKHIRERLSKGRSTIMDELMQVGDSLSRDKTHFPPPPANTDAPAHPTPVLHSSKQTDRIVEELVAEYLPRMEAELRKRLREQLSRSANHKVTDPETSS